MATEVSTNLMKDYNGYIYIWFDTIERLYYVGGHYGQLGDGYICSNTMLRGIYNRRPNTLRFKIIEYIKGDKQELRNREQYWLDLIKPEELYLGNKPRYFNQKKHSSGGNGRANKGNSNIGGHNRFTWKLTKPDGTFEIIESLKSYCNQNKLTYSTLYNSYRHSRPAMSGPCKGMILTKVS